jgi:hypothetical protein
MATPDHKHPVERHKAPPRPDLGREEIGACDSAPVGAQECLPRRRPLRDRLRSGSQRLICLIRFPADSGRVNACPPQDGSHDSTESSALPLFVRGSQRARPEGPRRDPRRPGHDRGARVGDAARSHDGAVDGAVRTVVKARQQVQVPASRAGAGDAAGRGGRRIGMGRRGESRCARHLQGARRLSPAARVEPSRQRRQPVEGGSDERHRAGSAEPMEARDRGGRRSRSWCRSSPDAVAAVALGGKHFHARRGDFGFVAPVTHGPPMLVLPNAWTLRAPASSA